MYKREEEHLSSKDGKGEDDLKELIQAAAQLWGSHLTAADSVNINPRHLQCPCSCHEETSCFEACMSNQGLSH